MARIAAAAVIMLVGLLVTPLDAQPTTNVSITRMTDAVSKGAVCLDGSPPAYYFDEGHGNGIDNWLIYLEGGGWCVNHTHCQERTHNVLGNSTRRLDNMSFYGIISQSSTENPEFYSWNRIYVVYCDGSSFTGDMDAVDTAILSGSSAGGLAAMIHCDYYQELLPITAKVKCLPIASYFFHQENLPGRKGFDSVFEALVTLHGSAKALHPSCTSVMRPSLCFFPQYFLVYVKTPVFIAMSAFDKVQVSYNFFYEYQQCLLSNSCTNDQNEWIHELRREFLVELPKSVPSHRGIWITNCVAHDLPYSWAMVGKMKTLGYKTFPETFDDWYFDRRHASVIDTSEDAKYCSSIGISP
nr:pectin acetylesterase 8-like [Ipomoea batatas]